MFDVVGLSHVLKASADFVKETFRLFESGEMATFFQDVVVHEIRVSFFNPALRRAKNFMRKNADPSRHGYLFLRLCDTAKTFQ